MSSLASILRTLCVVRRRCTCFMSSCCCSGLRHLLVGSSARSARAKKYSLHTAYASLAKPSRASATSRPFATGTAFSPRSLTARSHSFSTPSALQNSNSVASARAATQVVNMSLNKTVGFIGSGQMAEALIRGFIKAGVTVSTRQVRYKRETLPYTMQWLMPICVKNLGRRKHRSNGYQC